MIDFSPLLENQSGNQASENYLSDRLILEVHGDRWRLARPLEFDDQVRQNLTAHTRRLQERANYQVWYRAGAQFPMQGHSQTSLNSHQ